MAAVKLDEKGQILIPEEIRRRHGWREGTELEFTEVQGHVHVRRVLRDPVTGKTQQEMTSQERVAALDRWIKEFRGVLKGRVTTDEAMELTRGED